MQKKWNSIQFLIHTAIVTNCELRWKACLHYLVTKSMWCVMLIQPFKSAKKIRSWVSERNRFAGLLIKIRPVWNFKICARWSNGGATYGDSMVIKRVWLDRDSVMTESSSYFFSLSLIRLGFLFMKCPWATKVLLRAHTAMNKKILN
jgi:hypothetical protein